MKPLALAAVGLLAGWVFLAFVLAWPSGWAHLPFAAAVLVSVVAMVKADERRG